SLSEVEADIVMLGERMRPEDGSPGAMLASCSMMLASCAALQSMRPLGFVDLKEQGLRELRDQFDIRVLARSDQVSAALRTRDEYIAALRALALRRVGQSDDRSDPLAERWRPAFAITSPGAEVAATAKLCDSV